MILRKSPMLYSFAYHAQRWLSFRPVGAAIRRLPFRLQHIRASTIIAGPGFLGFRGGVFNPGAVLVENGDICLLAKGQMCHWCNAVGMQAHLAHRGDPVAIILDKMFVTRSCHIVPYDAKSPDKDLAIEDFRLFCYQDEVWVVHGTMHVVREPCKAAHTDARQTLSRYDPKQNTLVFLGYPRVDFPVRQFEKNWVFAVHRGELFLFYSFQPYRVLRLRDRASLSFVTVIDRPQVGKLADIGGFGSMVSFSANPIDYDERHWLLIVHQVEKGNWVARCYHQWAILLDKETLLPKKYIPRPLFNSLGARGPLPGLLYVMSVITVEDAFVFFCGEGDAYVTRITVSKEKLDREWVNMSV